MTNEEIKKNRQTVFGLYYMVECQILARKHQIHILYNDKESKDNDPGESGQETDKYIHRLYRNRLRRRT